MKFLTLILICLMALSHCQAVLRLRSLPKSGIEFEIHGSVSLPKGRLEPAARIAGGELAPEGSAPWQVSVQNQYGDHISGGAIIADNYILTAANSVTALDKRNLKVITGTNNWMNPSAEYEVEGIIIHCNFDKPLYHNDVALIKLKHSIVYDEKTQNISLADFDELREGEILTMTGWGSQKLGDLYSAKLTKLDIPYISNKDCIEMFDEYAGNVDLGNLCVQPKKGSGACHGDSGNPLVNSQGQLVGIENWGVPCGHGFPEVFARVSFYSDWIRTSMKGCSLKN